MPNKLLSWPLGAQLKASKTGQKSGPGISKKNISARSRNGIIIFFLWSLLLLLSPPKPDFASKRPDAQKYPAPSGTLLSKRSEVVSSCWRATEWPLYEKGESKEEEEKRKHTTHTVVVARNSINSSSSTHNSHQYAPMRELEPNRT